MLWQPLVLMSTSGANVMPTSGVDAEAEVHGKASALSEDEKYHEKHGGQYSQLADQQPLPIAAVVLQAARVGRACDITSPIQKHDENEKISITTNMKRTNPNPNPKVK